MKLNRFADLTLSLCLTNFRWHVAGRSLQIHICWWALLTLELGNNYVANCYAMRNYMQKWESFDTEESNYNNRQLLQQCQSLTENAWKLYISADTVCLIKKRSHQIQLSKNVFLCEMCYVLIQAAPVQLQNTVENNIYEQAKNCANHPAWINQYSWNYRDFLQNCCALFINSTATAAQVLVTVDVVGSEKNTPYISSIIFRGYFLWSTLD